MADALGILRGDGTCAADVVADALAASDAQAAEILRAQAAWLRDGTGASRARATALVAAITDPKNLPAWRSQIWMGGLFDHRLTLLPAGDGLEAWLYDDDIATLGDLADGDDIDEHPWARNTGAAEALDRLLASTDAKRVRALRLLSFEGTRRFAETLRARGALDRVTHVELRLQRECEETSLPRVFPALSGLCCAAADLRALLADESDSLRALVVCGELRSVQQLLRSAKKAPGLRHLGVHYARWDADRLATLLRSPTIRRLTSLELYDVNGAAEFPFEDLVASQSAWRHLRHLALPGHCVVRDPRLAELPNVTFVGHDRREVLALDLETRGWARNTR
ncbi:MAG: hypothetical protein IT379_27555 [Deltaproteobacteria bacterium]|nr:hypothetical protein [Deltaproteobacteria bacterium]